MKEQGCAVIIITHKLNEVMEISDRVTVLRKRRTIGTSKTADASVSDMIEMMVGKKVFCMTANFCYFFMNKT